MKRSHLLTGVLYLISGIIALVIVLITETKLDGLLWGLAGAGILPGSLMIGQYFYWSSPKRKDHYAEKLEQERIEIHDELNQHIRDRAGYLTLITGMLLISGAMIVISALGDLELIPYSRPLVLTLFGILVIQINLLMLNLQRLRKKYRP